MRRAWRSPRSRFALGIGFVVLGFLVRRGKGWLVAVNVAAVAGFLELTSGSAQGILFGALDVAVVLILMRHRPWFHWSPDERTGNDPAGLSLAGSWVRGVAGISP